MRTGSQTTFAGDAGVLGCRLATCMQVLWLDVRTGSQTTNVEDAGILGCRLASCVVAGCEDWVANNTCWGCRDLGLQVGNLLGMLGQVGNLRCGWM